MLSTGFMIGGACGAVASADTDSSKPASSQGSDSAAPAANPTRGPIATIADSLRKQVQSSLQSTVQSVTGSLNSLPSPAQIQAALPKPPAVSFGGTPTVHGTSTFGSSTPTADPTPAATPLATPSTSTPSTSTPSTSTPSTGTPAITAPAALNPLAAASQAAPDVVTPVTNALAAAANSAATTVASIPAALPITQVVTGVQDVLASVASAGVSLSQLPTDLSDLLGVSAVSTTAGTGSSTGHVGGPATVTAPVPLPTSAPLPPILAMPGVDGVPATAPVVGHATPLDVIAAGANRGVATTSAPLLAPHDTTSTDTLSVVEHVIGAFVASVSLTALIAWALPGIGGLLGTCAAGIRVGYRQAKAGSELPDTAISRFVGSGPVGVVRSGSLISLRPRATRAARQSVPDEAPARRLRAVPAAAAQVDVLDKAV